MGTSSQNSVLRCNKTTTAATKMPGASTPNLMRNCSQTTGASSDN